MKNFFKDLLKIKKKISRFEKCLLVFDFDGTLSEITRIPDEAFLENSTKILLEKIKNYFEVAIVSGRSLLSLKKKVSLQGITYAGSHGFEWQHEDGEKNKIKISLSVKKKLSLVKKRFIYLASIYPGLLSEDKLFSIALHYRNLLQQYEKQFKKDSEKIVLLIEKEEELDLIKGKKVIEVRPKMRWNKGHFVKFLQKYFEEKNNQPFFTFYVGDDITDEDAFSKLNQEGITIRIGRKDESYAKYFIDRSELNKFLSCLLDLKMNI